MNLRAQRKPVKPKAGQVYGGPWTESRLSAAVAATRPHRARFALEQALRDELDFFADIGTRHEVSSGVALVQRGKHMREIHLVQQGAVALLDESGTRRPIVAFTLQKELCCAVPALFEEAPSWDAVTVLGTSLITVSTDRFMGAVHERWADRWSTRTLSWLAEVGARVADLDARDMQGQVAALLLRHGGELPVDLCRQTICDLLDVEDDVVRPILAELQRLGGLRVVDGRVAVAQAGVLRASACVPPRYNRADGRQESRHALTRSHPA
jgi:hypothetical protein